jgi:hypothetical protein
MNATMNATRHTTMHTTRNRQATKLTTRRPVMTKQHGTRTAPRTAKAKVAMTGWTLAAVVMSFIAGCAPEMDPPSLVEKTRVIGARVEVTGEPGRATPTPGETARVTWLVTAPDEVPALGWAFALCPGRGGAEEGCGAEPLAVFQGHDRVPVLDIAVPAAEALGQARELVLFGRICSASEPMLDPATGEPGCTMNGDGTTALVTIPLELADATNRNPSFTGRAAAFDGQAWAATEATDCADLPTVKAATEDHLLRLETDASDRETYTAMIGDPPVPTQRRESLQISQFTTAGKLARSYSAIEATDKGARPAIEVKWKAPDADKVPAAGLVVHFTFVARDLRGGADWTSRAVCVTK